MEEMNVTNHPEEQVESGIDLRDVFSALLSKALWIGLITVVCLAAAFGYTKMLPSMYQSEASIYVDNKNMGSSSDVTVANFLARDCMALIQDHNMLNHALDRLRAGGVGDFSEMTYKELGKMINLTLSNEDSRMIRVTVLHEEPAVAKAIVDAVCDVAQNEINETIGGERGEGRINPVGGKNPATLPTKPIDRNLLQNMLITGAVGFIASSMVFVLIYILDDKIKNADQVQSALGLSTLGMIPHQKHGNSNEE